MPNYQATWRAVTGEHSVVVDRVGKIFQAPNLLEAKRVASQLSPHNMTLIKVRELVDDSDPEAGLNARQHDDA